MVTIKHTRVSDVPCKQHSLSNPQQRIIFLRTKILQSHGRTHVHGWKWWHTLQQWCCPQYLANNLSSHVIRGGGRIGCSFHQCENSRLNVPNAHRTWTLTTTHTNANQQRNGTCATHQQNITKGTQSHGFAFPLAEMLQCTGQILLLLETRHTERGRLLHQASPNQPPQICPPHNTNTRQRSRIHETLQGNNNTSNIWTTNQNIESTKIVCQESTTNTKVQDHDHQHSHSKKCLKILRQECVRPTSKYVLKWWDKSPNKQQFMPKLRCPLSHN